MKNNEVIKIDTCTVYFCIIWKLIQKFCLQHPSFCPIRNLSPIEDSRLPDDIKHRGIDVGAAVILESADNKILLTRRSKHLRTFPGVWVPPGKYFINCI